MKEEELKEQVKKAFSAMHDDELYDSWEAVCENGGIDCEIYTRNYLSELFKNLSDFYFASHNGKIVGTENLTVDFLPIADNLSEAIDYVVENKDDLGNARLEEVLYGSADEGAFMSFEDDFLRTMRTLTTQELVKAYNECMSRSPEAMIYPIDEFCELWDSSEGSDEALDASGDRFSFNDDWFYAVNPNYNVFESFTDLTIDDEPINENLEYILQDIVEGDNDFGIQKIRDFIENRKAYGDFD